MMRTLAVAALVAIELGLAGCGGSSPQSAGLAGDWDYERMLGAAPNGGFEARRRFGFAHFDGPSATGAWLKRRSGDPLETITSVELTGDALVLSLGADRSIRGVLAGDTVTGQIYQAGKPIDRIWLTRRTTSPVWEPTFALWPGPVSESTYQVTIDPAMPMKARDGVTLMSYVARPVGAGPFAVVMERTPYLRTDPAAGNFWASRGYIYVKQDVRGRGGSGGVLDMNALQEQDGYDAVEWAAALPGSSGKVGLIGRSNPGLYAWYAAIAQPPHLTTIAPVVATADPLRLVPYIDMVFSPTIIPWLCLTGVKETMSDISNVDEVRAFNHLPVIESAELAGCPRPKYWNDWFDHQQDDAYWRGLSIERRLDRVTVPVLGIAGWYDDARGTIRNYTAMAALPHHPPLRVVMDPGAHKGIDYVNGDFGRQARLDHRLLQLRWFDHYLKGVANGVDTEAPLDFFVMGDNAWRHEREWPLARTVWTNYYLHAGGVLNTTPPGDEASDDYTYDPRNPTPYLVDARELELNINENYQTVHAERKDLVTYTTAPLEHDMEITGPMTATLWASTDARDTDWNVMILDVEPNGAAWRIQDGVVRARFRDGFDKPALLTPGAITKYDIDVWFTSLVIPKGHRLRVSVASAAFPKYDRNLNTGGDNERDTKYVPARQRIVHDAAHPSSIRLPVIPR
jgi:putative CocE/NonD family hydrolase